MAGGLFELRRDDITGWWVATVVDREFQRARFARPARRMGTPDEKCQNCDPARAAVVADAIGCSWGNLAHVGGCKWDVLVNATPLGSGGLEGEAPVPAELHREGTVVLDMVYEPRETRLLREARAGGATAVGGLEMLIAQAARQFETWTGKEAPIDAMRAAVDAAGP